MGFTKPQVEFIKRAFEQLIGIAKFVECSWYGYKSHSHPIEINILTLKDDSVIFYEYQHDPGKYGFHIGTSYGVTGCPSKFADISISADKRTIHFRYNDLDNMVYRSFMPIEDGDMNSWKLWDEFMRESWKL